jgi:hypothetical protein
VKKSFGILELNKNLKGLIMEDKAIYTVKEADIYEQ